MKLTVKTKDGEIYEIETGIDNLLSAKDKEIEEALKKQREEIMEKLLSKQQEVWGLGGGHDFVISVDNIKELLK